MGGHRLPKRVMSGKLENKGKRGPGGEEKLLDTLLGRGTSVFGITEDWSIAAVDPLGLGAAQYAKETVGSWPRGSEERKRRPKLSRRREKRTRWTRLIAPGMAVASLRRFKAAWIGPIQ